ncbi:hypothetical protein F5Y15DRAFT_422876 [Xylariaceae sp. FL0016]|nr:hypothetical protein F5Y15DRAFT_422876 [Xylariaceae sp. FL0016]
MKLYLVILLDLFLASAPVVGVKEVRSPPSVTPRLPSGSPAPPYTFSTTQHMSLATIPASSTAPPAPSGNLSAPKCGKGFTYCGSMLTQGGHNFTPNDISHAYCSGLEQLCSTPKPATDPNQAVYYCLSDQPSSISLLCACSGKCVNDAATNYIAHCDKPCVNGPMT